MRQATVVRPSRARAILLAAILLTGANQAKANSCPAPASDPDARADCTLAAMSLEDKLAMVLTREGGGFNAPPIPAGALGSAAFLVPPAHLGLPALEVTDGAVGVTDPGGIRKDGAATSFPSSLGIAASWDVDLAHRTGAQMAEEARRHGFNVLLAGGINLIRDPRGGRSFEYSGEDPLLAGRIGGASIAGIQSRHVLSTVKHFVANDFETARLTANVNIAPAALRESDLLAFQIAIETGHPGAVMCAYNRVNTRYACENADLLTGVLKRDWGYPGFVMSDWGATHSTVRAALAGLDQESSGDTMDSHLFFGPAALGEAVRSGAVPQARLGDMVRRILRSMYRVGLVDDRPVKQPLDRAAGRAAARMAEEQAAVLLRNTGLLPLARGGRVLVVGGHADVGVLSGGGSSQVMPLGDDPVNGPWTGKWTPHPVYVPSSPLAAMRGEAPAARIDFVSGSDVARAAQLARGADAVIVFATQWTREARDLPDLSLPDGQDALISALGDANRKLVVVLETNGPVLMPWLDKTAAVIEAWYPGAGGGEALARLIYGTTAPSGHLPVTFPASAAQLPRPTIPGALPVTPFDTLFHIDQEVEFNEGADVGYRWFERTGAEPLFAFGYGLTYTSFERADLKVTPQGSGRDRRIAASFTIKNTGPAEAADVAQLYVTLPDGGARRLAGWARVALKPGESRRVTVDLDPRLFARFDAAANRWQIAGGTYAVRLASSARDAVTPLSVRLRRWSFGP